MPQDYTVDLRLGYKLADTAHADAAATRFLEYFTFEWRRKWSHIVVRTTTAEPHEEVRQKLNAYFKANLHLVGQHSPASPDDPFKPGLWIPGAGGLHEGSGPVTYGGGTAWNLGFTYNGSSKQAPIHADARFHLAISLP